MCPLLPLVLLIAGCSTREPTDEQLEGEFRANQVAFLQLRTSLCQQSSPRIVMMDPEWSQPLASTPDRETLYALFKQIGARGVYYDGNCSFRVMVWGAGFAGGGSSKGYSYRPLPEWAGSQLRIGQSSV